jgi:hypothetical protein
LPVLDVLYTPDFLNSRSREPLFLRILISGSAAMTRPVRVNAIAGSVAVTLRWIIILVFPFITLPGMGGVAGWSASAEPDKVYDNLIVLAIASRLAGGRGHRGRRVSERAISASYGNKAEARKPLIY